MSTLNISRRAQTAVALVLSLALGACSSAIKKEPEAPVDAKSAKEGKGFAISTENLGVESFAAMTAVDDKTPSFIDDSFKAGYESDQKNAALVLGKESATSKPTASKKAPRPVMSKSAQKSFQNGQKAFLAGDLQGALTQYESAIKSDSKAYEAHYAKGVVLERMGKGDAAKKSYDRALGVVSDHEETIVANGILLARQENPDVALKFLKSKSNSVGKSAAILAAMAEVNSMKGQSAEAQELAQKALKVNPNFKPAMVVLARDHYRSRRIDLALYALTGILDGYGDDNPPRDKNNAEARMIRGLIYAERGLRGPAMEEMEKALAVRPDLVDAHLVLANFMMAAGNAKDARPHLEMAIRYDNKNVPAHLQLGDAYRLLNKTGDARRELEWVLAADPNQSAAHYNLGLLFLLSAKIKGVSEEAAVDKALEHLEAYKARAGRGGPDDVDDLITRAKTKKALLKAAQPAGTAGG